MQYRTIKTSEKVQKMEDIEDIMKMMAKVELPTELKQKKEVQTRVSNQEEDMLTIKNASESWQFGKVVNVFEGDSKMPALVISLKEYTTNALLLGRSPASLVGRDLQFEMP